FRRWRRCSEKSWCMPTFPPDHRVLGIVGIIQDGSAKGKAATKFSVEWVDGSTGTVVVSGPCFAAVSQSRKPALRINGPSENKKDSFIINDAFGFRLIDVPDINVAAYSGMKIP